MGFPKTDLFKDEQLNCKSNECPKGQYLCQHQSYCIDIELICDGISHCIQGDDELDCGKNECYFYIIKYNLTGLFKKKISLCTAFSNVTTKNVIYLVKKFVIK